MSDTTDVEKLGAAIAALADALRVTGDDAGLAGLPDAVRNTLLAGVVQTIEFVYELSIKTMRREMERRSDSPAQVDHRSFKDAIRTAFEMGLVNDPVAWFRFREMRNITSRTYDRAKADEVIAQAPALLAHARTLLARVETPGE